MAPRFIARQLSRPSGFIGVAIRHLMNRHNARMNAFAIQQLQLGPADHVLEIGFGGGVTLPALLNAAAFTAGVDRSSDVIDWAQRHFNKAIKAGRAEFRQGNVESLPFERTTFDKTCTVNTVYFWTSLDAGFAEIHRVLKPRGRVVVGFLPKERMDRMGMPEDIFTTRAPRDVIEALTKAGFCDARVERPEPKTPWNVIVAAKAAPPN
ncbi:MAG: class I SAM-dependent methyltransferase [Pseudolabrys sp.]